MKIKISKVKRERKRVKNNLGLSDDDMKKLDKALEEFSQEHLGIYIVDVNVVNEEYVLDLYDQCTYYPKPQSKEDKIESIRQNWFSDTHTKWVAENVWGAWKVNE